MHSYAQKIISSYAVSLEEFPHDPFSIDEMNASGKVRLARTSEYGRTRPRTGERSVNHIKGYF